MRWWLSVVILICCLQPVMGQNVSGKVDIIVSVQNSPVEVLFLDLPDFPVPGEVVRFAVRDNNTLIDVDSITITLAGISLDPVVVVVNSTNSLPHVALYEATIPDFFGLTTFEVVASDTDSMASLSSPIMVNFLTGEDNAKDGDPPAPPAPAGRGRVVITTDPPDMGVVSFMFSALVITVAAGSILKSSFLRGSGGSVDIAVWSLGFIYILIILLECI